MIQFIVVASGGAIGALARYIIGGLDYRFSNSLFPLSTLVVNASGSLIIGFLWGMTERFLFSSNVRMFIFIGVLGGYTTFSTFSLETFNLIRSGEYRLAFINVLLSVILSVSAVFLGYFSFRILINLFNKQGV